MAPSSPGGCGTVTERLLSQLRTPAWLIVYFIGSVGTSEEVRASIGSFHSAIEFSELDGELVKLLVDSAHIVVDSEFLYGLFVLLSLELVDELSWGRESGDIAIEIAFLCDGVVTKYFLGSSK